MKKTYIVDMEKVKDSMYRRLWTWHELADESNISEGFLMALQSGRRGASMRTVYKLSKVLNIKPQKLIIEEKTAMKYSKVRALEAAKYLERFCLYFKLDKPDCQGCPFDDGKDCLLNIPECWGVTQRFSKKDNK